MTKPKTLEQLRLLAACRHIDVLALLLCRLSAFYGVSVDYLLGLTDEKKPYPRRK